MPSVGKGDRRVQVQAQAPTTKLRGGQREKKSHRHERVGKYGGVPEAYRNMNDTVKAFNLSIRTASLSMLI